MGANKPRDGDQRITVIRQIIHLSRQHLQLCTSYLDETGIGSGQVPVLMELERAGELSQRELAEKTRVTPATMSGTLKRMERAGLIVRAADENDARISRVRLTEAGYAQCGRAHTGFDKACRDILEVLDEGEVEALGALLGRVQKALPPICRKGNPPMPPPEEERVGRMIRENEPEE